MKEETKVSYDKEAYIKKKREQLDNACLLYTSDAADD